jgi:[ribosomal protein S5]-alanine N-acetyltransferase
MDETRIQAAPIETERLRLRKLCTTDAGDIFDYASDPEVTRYVFFNTHAMPEQTIAYIASFGRPSKTAWAMVHRAEDRVIGIVFLHSIKDDCATAELAYNVARDLWGKGFATEAARAILSHCFTCTDLQTIEGACMIDHAASARVLEKAGLQFREIREKSRSKNGVAYDLRHYAIGRQEWLASNG